MNNSVFGKTMENIRKRFSCEIRFNRESVEYYINRMMAKDIIEISDSLFVVELYKD